MKSVFLTAITILLSSTTALISQEQNAQPDDAETITQVESEAFGLATSSEIALPPEMSVSLGLGFNSLQGIFRGTAVDAEDSKLVSLRIDPDGFASELDFTDLSSQRGTHQPIGQQIRYQFDYADDLYDLRESLSVSAEAAFGGSSFSASAKAAFFSSFTLNERSSYVIFTMTVINAMQRLESCQLSEASSDMINSGNTGRFFTTFGDEYITSITTGGELSIVFEVVSKTQEEKETLDLDFAVGYGAFSASASMEQRFSELLSNRQVNVRFLKRGGSEGIFTTDTEGDVSQVVLSIFEMAQAFPNEVKENPIQVAATTTDYNSCLGANRVVPTFYHTRLLIEGVVGLLELYGEPLQNYQLCIQTSLSAGCLPSQGGANISDLQNRILNIYENPFEAERNPEEGRRLISELESVLRTLNLPAPPIPAAQTGTAEGEQ